MNSLPPTTSSEARIWRSLRCESTGEFSTIWRACSGTGTNTLHSGPICVRQRHHDRLAQRIDRRIGDLRELLAEIVVQRADLVRQHRHRRVIAHGADRLALILGEHADDLVALLGGDAEHLLIDRERLAIHGLGGEPRIDQIGFADSARPS